MNFGKSLEWLFHGPSTVTVNAEACKSFLAYCVTMPGQKKETHYGDNVFHYASEWFVPGEMYWHYHS